MNPAIITLSGVSKVYHLYARQSDRLMEAISLRKKQRHKDFYALQDISLQINQNQCVGIIGTNGSGKSTLLKLICGVLTPTTGTIDVQGKISALLELGAGFNPEYTGIENIFLNGAMMGYSKEEIEAKVEMIADFANIGEFLYQPVKTYSSGMFARLAFAVSINTEPDVLIVDEALSVGDIRFQQKCFRKIAEIKKNTTVLMVSHDMSAISKFCDYAIWIEKGSIRAQGDPFEITKQYQAYLMESKLSVEKSQYHTEQDHTQDFKLIPVDDSLESYGNKNSEIVAFGLFDTETDTPIEYVSGNQKVRFYLKVVHHIPPVEPIVGLTVYDRLGNNIFGVNSFLINDDVVCNRETVIYYCEFTMPELNEGVYSISPAFADGTQKNHSMCHWVFDAFHFKMVTRFLDTLPGILAPQEYHFHIL